MFLWQLDFATGLGSLLGLAIAGLQCWGVAHQNPHV